MGDVHNHSKRKQPDLIRWKRGDTLRVSKKCIEMVKEFEGLYLETYKDAVGVNTIGYGITNADKDISGKTIKKGMEIDKATAELWLEECLNKKYLPKVLKYQSRYGFNTSQIDALTSFAYNIGSIDQLTANGTRSKAEIQNKILLYNKAGGKVLKGLERRRKAEQDMYKGPIKTFDEGWPTLPKRGYFQEGDKGEQVKKVQRFLSWMDLYSGEIDGLYGPKTVDAVKALQTKVRTSRNGKFGNKCLPWAKKFRK